MTENEGKAELTLEQVLRICDRKFPPTACACGACDYCAWTRLQEIIETMAASAFVCPHCGSYLVRNIEYVEEKFLYGDTELEHTHPVRACLSCGEQWVDMEHAYSQSEAIVKHLQGELTRIRENAGYRQRSDQA